MISLNYDVIMFAQNQNQSNYRTDLANMEIILILRLN